MKGDWDLVLEHLPRLKDKVRRTIRNPGLHDDAIQLGVMFLYRKSKTFDPSKASFWHFCSYEIDSILQECYQGVVKLPRKTGYVNGYRVRYTDIKGIDIEQQTTPVVTREQYYEILDVCRIKLDKIMAAILDLRWQWKTGPQIATALNMKLADVEHRTFMFHQKLRKRVQQLGLTLDDFREEVSHERY